MKLIATFILFLIIFIASANESVIGNACTNSTVETYSSFTQKRSHSILNSLTTHRDYEFVMDIEEEEEDEKSKWLLAIIYALIIDSSNFNLKTDNNCFYVLKNITPTQPRYLLFEVFIV